MRFGALFADRARRDQREHELSRELETALQLHIDDNLRGGMTPVEARRQAMLAFGGLEQTKERYRDRRGLPIVEEFVRDVRHACRRLLRTPGVALAILLTLSVALGLNASVFATADALFLRPFTFPNVDRLVLIEETRPEWRWTGRTSAANFQDWTRSKPAGLTGLSALGWRDVEIGGSSNPERLHGTLVSANFFGMIGLSPAHGRWFSEDEETPGNHRRVVLSHPLWERRFHASSDIVGQSIVIDGLPHDVVGIAPEGFDFPFGTQLWVPLAFEQKDLVDRDDRALLVVGRLADDANVASVQSAMTSVAQELARLHERAGFRSGARVRTLTAGLREQDSGAMHAFLQGAALFVLLIACTNIINLILALGVERQREVAVRFALGATRLQIFRTLWLESALLALLAVPPALLIADISLDLIRNSLPPRIALVLPGWQNINVDGRLLMCAAVLAGAAALLFGLLPAVQASIPKPDALKEGARGLTSGASRQRLRHALIVAQVALVMPLLVSAAAAWNGASQLASASQGYQPDGLVATRLMLPERRYGDAQARRSFAASLERDLAGLPGITGAALSNHLPSTGMSLVRPIAVEGRTASAPTAGDQVEHRVVTPQYFDTMKIKILRGRGFNESDLEGALPVAIVSKSVADRYWLGDNPIGRRIRHADDDSKTWITIVGVADNVVEDWFWGRDALTAYRPFRQDPPPEFELLVRVSGDPTVASSQIRTAIGVVDPEQPLTAITPMRRMIHERLAAPRTISTLMGTLGAMALALAAIGLFGIIAHLVGQRTHEIGLRIAFGASRRDVIRLVVKDAMRLAGVGLSIGAVLSIGALRLLESALFAAGSVGPWVIVYMMALIATVGLTATYLPALRATRIKPAVALRNE
jgi:putative ABC transport system permease protein